jgi:UDP:flavonoid glycosyltransferase YjiC (YdhE family)
MTNNLSRKTEAISTNETRGRKVLFATFPADGHFNPLTGLAVHLKELGYDVRWYTSLRYSAKLKRLGIPQYPFKNALDIDANNLEKLFPERANKNGQISKLKFDMIHAFILRGPEFYSDLQEIHKSFPFELMIADCAFTGIPFVKDKMNIPVVSIGVFPLVETSKDLPPSGLGMTPSKSRFGRIKQNVLRLLADRVLFAEPNKVMRKVLDEYNIPHNGENIFNLMVKKSTIFLQSGTPGFEYKRSDLGKNIRYIGSLLPFREDKKHAPWFDARLNLYDKIILVTQGTVERDVTKIIEPTLEAFKDSSYLVIATTGGSKTKELQDKFPQKNIIIEDFVPFDDVMPYADVYITNGGYGGVMLGIEHELPLVVAGVHEGKNEINARVGYFNLGVNLKTEKPKAEQIKNAVEQVLRNEVYKQNVKDLGEEFHRYHPAQLTAAYVADLLKTNTKYVFRSSRVEETVN